MGGHKAWGQKEGSGDCLIRGGVSRSMQRPQDDDFALPSCSHRHDPSPINRQDNGRALWSLVTNTQPTHCNHFSQNDSLAACLTPGWKDPSMVPLLRPHLSDPAQPPGHRDLSQERSRLGTSASLAVQGEAPGAAWAPFLAQGLQRPLRAPLTHPPSLCCRAGMLLISVQRAHYFAFQTRKPHLWS